MAMALHYIHTLCSAVSAGTWLWMGLVLFHGTFPNNCDVLSGGDLPHKSHLLPSECSCVHESDCSVHNKIVVYTTRLNENFHMYIENELTGFPYVALQVLLVLCGIWSLDFFRSVIPPFCVSSHMKTVHALALEYLVAFYPIFLILITSVCIKLHDNNFRSIVWLWKPFHRHFAHLRRRWDSTASIINAFTTFLLLSFSKILFVSFTLLHTFTLNYDNIPSKCVLYFDSTVECHTQEYNILSAIAFCVLVIFIICPTILLILYPTRL